MTLRKEVIADGYLFWFHEQPPCGWVIYGEDAKGPRWKGIRVTHFEQAKPLLLAWARRVDLRPTH